MSESDKYIVFDKEELERAFDEYDPNGTYRAWLEHLQIIVELVREKESNND